MQKLLVIRNDKLGDFMLIFPALALIKRAFPKLEITALVPEYTAPMAMICPFIDKVILDVDSKNKKAVNSLINRVRNERFDAVINFYLNWHNAKLSWQAGIKQRFAPATKAFQFLCNRRITQRRSQSLKPEYEYNLDLARAFLENQQLEISEVNPPYLQFPTSTLEEQKSKLQQQLGLEPNAKLVFVHCGTGGSANSLSLAQFSQIIDALLEKFPLQVVLTAGNEQECQQVTQLMQKIKYPERVKPYLKNDGLEDFALSLACGELFVGGSTGPLHIAGALNIATIGFYPSRCSATALRWQTTNDPHKRLSFSAPVHQEMDLTAINISQALPQILAFVQSQLSNN